MQKNVDLRLMTRINDNGDIEERVSTVPGDTIDLAWKTSPRAIVIVGLTLHDRGISTSAMVRANNKGVAVATLELFSSGLVGEPTEEHWYRVEAFAISGTCKSVAVKQDFRVTPAPVS